MNPPRHTARSRLAALLLAVTTWMTLALGAPDADASSEELRLVTQADLEAIRTALLAHLRASSLGDRDELIALTQKARGVIDPDGTKHIGFWDLESGSSGLVLVIRLTSGPDLIVNYRASVRKDEQTWRVDAVEPEFIHGRR